MLNVKNLKVRFKNTNNFTDVIFGIDFSLNKNEILGIVGESGSGKTVTALSVLKLLPKSTTSITGEINFNGQDILKLSEKEMLGIRGSKIAMVFQEPFTSLNPVIRIGDQIDETMLFHEGMSGPDAKKETLNLLSKVKINDPERIYRSYPHSLSGGERQRVMIAMAVALKPEILIADEPTTSLDVTIQKDILALLLKLKEEMKMSIIFITHDFGIVKEIADRVVVMKNGFISESGNKKDVLSSPKSEYTKKLIKAVPRIGLKMDDENIEIRSDVINVENVSKTFHSEENVFKTGKNHVKALNNVSLKVKEGETLGLVGESGSGKTTLGRIITGLLKPDSGRVTIKEKAIQIVFQDPYSSLDPRMRMGEIVTEGLTVRGTHSKKKDVMLEKVLFKVNLNFKDRFKYPHQFSGGERQRIAIARSLAVNPKILVLDEPVSSLDVIIQADILKLLKNLQEELNLTYVFISHDLRVVEYMADRVAVMKNGQILETGTSYEIYSSPKHDYTKKLLYSVLTV